MKQNWKKALALLLAFLILFETSVAPAAAAEAAEDQTDQTTSSAEEAAVSATEQTEPVLLGELEELRTESTRQFRLSDGSLSLVQYETDVHYQDEEGNWQQIDNSLSASDAADETDSAGYATKEGRVNFKFARNPNANFLVRIKQGDYHLFFSLQDAQKKSDGAKVLEFTSGSGDDSSFARQVEVENIHSGVLYEDILPATDIEYITSGSDLKENIIVKEKRDSYQYVFEIKTNKLDVREEEDGSISFLAQDTGRIVYSMPAMYMVDGQGEESQAVSFTLTSKNKKHTLTITADADWINAEERVFPVTIDPTLQSSNSSVDEESRIIGNQYVALGNPNYDYVGRTSGYVGYGEDNLTYRMLVQFTSLPKLPADCIINRAEIYYALTAYGQYQMSQMPVGVYEVTGDWAWGDRLTWNTQPAYSSTVLDYEILSNSKEGSYVSWDITKLIKTHYEEKDNSTAATSFVLAAVNEGDFDDSHRARAVLVQENSSGYFENAQPVLTISYRSSRGVEDYYTYQTLDLGSAGTAYIGDYTKEFTIVRPIISNNSSVMPFTISLVYNSAFGDQFFTSSVDIHTKDYFTKMKLGNGWKLNIQQTVVETIIGDKSYLIFNDEDSTEHYFYLDEKDNKYKDEDGLKLTITKTISDGNTVYVMTDEKNNQKVFHNGFLSSIVDPNGNAVYILYNDQDYTPDGSWYASATGSNRVSKVIQVNNGQDSYSTIATFIYNENLTGNIVPYVHGMTDANGRTYRFVYTHAGYSESNVHYGWNITQIIDPDGTYASYNYYTKNTSGINRLASTRDSDTELGYQFSYRATNFSNRLSSFSSVHWSDSTAIVDQQVDITNTQLLRVDYRDWGLDRVCETDDDILTYMMFDNEGRTISRITTNSTRTNYYGTSASAYSTDATTEHGNKLLNHVSTGMVSANMLKNSGAESASNTWSIIKHAADTSLVTADPRYNGAARSGSYSLYSVVDDEAIPNSDNTLGADFYTSVALTAGKTYTFSGYFKNTDAASFRDNGTAYLQVNDPDGNLLTTSTIQTAATSEEIDNGWVRLYATFTPAESGTYKFFARTNKLFGVSVFDDLQLEEGNAPSRYNYLENGDMEWMDDWTLTNGVWQSGGHIYGAHNLTIVGYPTERRETYTTVPMNVSANNTFVLSGWAAGYPVADVNKSGIVTSSDGRRFGLEATVNYSDGTSEKHFVSFDSSAPGLQYTSGNVVPKQPSKTISSIKVSCVYAYGANTVYFDTISLRMEPVSTYSYDDEGHLVSATQKGAETLDFTYQSGDLVKEVTEGNGIYEYEYDDKHNLTSATNDGVKMTLTYDAFGHVKTSAVASTTDTGARSMTTSAAYTADGSYLAAQTDAAGNTTTYATNAYGLTESVTDPLENKTSYTYDPSNDRLTKVSLDDGTAVNYTYGNGVLSSILRESLLPDGTETEQTYSFAYDVYGSVTEVKVGEQILASYEYMANNGPLTKITYGNGYTIEYGHDVLGRVISESRDGVKKYQYVYGSEGYLARLEELDSTGKVIAATCYEYDSLGRLIRSWEDVWGNTYLVRGLATEHLYDTSDRLTSQSWRYKDGTSRSESYTYNNEDGTLTSMVTASGKTLTLSYDMLKRLQSRSDGMISQSYSYRDVGENGTTTQIAGLTYSGLSDALAYAYTYDALGNITQISENGTVAASYAYDDQRQLIKEVLADRTVEYSYDTAGNIQSVTTTQNGATTTKTYSYNSTNGWKDQLTGYDGHTITYDGVGNPLTYYNGTDWTFTWTEGRKLAAATSADTSVSYTYDTDGYRTGKTVGDTAYNYIYLGGKLVRQTWGENILEFAYDDQGRPYSLTYNGTAYYYILDLQGDVVRIIDASGVTQASYTYDAWGNLLNDVTDGIGSVNPLRYRGYVWDVETGLYYLNSRYYDPGVRRMISADSISVLNTSFTSFYDKNLYSYCDNNPIIRIDVDGEWWHLAVGAVVGVLSQYACDVVANLQSGQSLSESLVPTSSIVDYAAAGLSGALAATGISTSGAIIANSVLGGTTFAIKCATGEEDFSLGKLVESTLIGAAAGAIGGSGVNGKNLRGIVATSKSVIKNTSSAKRVAQYSAKIVKCANVATKGIVRTVVATGASNILSKNSSSISRWLSDSFRYSRLK